MNRRGFLRGVIAAGVAPAFVRYGSLMLPRAPTLARRLSLLDAYEQSELMAARNSAMVAGFMENTLRQIAAGLSIPWEQVAIDFERVDYRLALRR